MLSLKFSSNKRHTAPKVTSGRQQKMSGKVAQSRVVRVPTARRKRQLNQDGECDVRVVTCSKESMSDRRALQGTPRKRGHQHHPRNHGNRRRQPNTTEKASKHENKCTLPAVASANNCDNKSVCDNSADQRILDNCNRINNNDQETSSSNINKNSISLTECDEVPKSSKSSRPSKSYKDIPRPAAEGSSQSDAENEDPEQEELAKLRCKSESSEAVAEREARRRRRRCADYPGLAFGSSIFSSDTMMRFSVIGNELHNIMSTQLKRVCQYVYS